jgi:protein O-mannosyl-transferase
MTSSVSDLPRQREATAGPKSAYRCWLFPLFLVLVTFIAYIPAWHGGFVWKDDQFILHNPYINFWQGLYRIWFKTSFQYYPLTYTTFWIEYHFWGMDPLGYHLVNIAFHAVDALLLWRVLLRLNVPGAWLAASIFALHPVNVESVAWVLERKNTLSCFFFLCSILAALKFWLPGEFRGSPESFRGTLTKAGSPQTSGPPVQSETPHPPSPGYRGAGVVSYNPLADWKFYWLSFGLFICALFSKTTTIPLPAVILLLVWWKRGRITWRDIYPCLPFLAAGVAVGLITHHFEQNLGAGGKEYQFSLVDRILVASRSFWFYLGKLIWPHPLIFVYPRWKIAPSPPVAWLALLAFVPVLAVLWLKRHTWGRTAFTALAYFGGMLFLMLGFFNIAFFLYSFVSDHFVYLACMGPFALFAAALTIAMCGKRGVPRQSLAKAGNESLVKSESAQTSGSENKLGTPRVVFCGYVIFSACLLAILASLTRRQCHVYLSAESLWRDTIAKNPRAFLAYNNLGDILYDGGQLDAAIAEYQKAVAIYPDAGVFHNLGNALLSRGHPVEAWADFQKESQLAPDSASAWADLGRYCLQAGRSREAIQYLQKAYQKTPKDAMVCYNLGNAYVQNQQLDPAIQYWQRAVDLQPGFALAQNNLGNAYHLKGQVAQAIEHWKAACMAQPNLVPSQVNLAWVWATCPDPALRDGPDALALAEQADQLTGGANPTILRVLAAALAENGRYSQAVAAAQQALQLARGNPGLAARIQQELKYYQNNQPFRDQTLTTGKSH